MQIKLVEIRDAATFIPALAIRLGARNEAERFLLGAAGYGLTAAHHAEYVILARINGGRGFSTSDPGLWNDPRTMAVAHQYLIDHWDDIESGAVICVEHILGERDTPKVSDRFRMAP